ncbi:hypothetical protein [Priestia megaterium]|uniref:hypothetical protein n=1 Tax=Priestia megaterium TaxID=1404 RepID=UPI0028780ED9|nr:hypothetical protein [Priestia megaterium]
MYFYTVSEGRHSDYNPVIMYHTDKFSRKDFIDIYNKSIDHIENQGNNIEIEWVVRHMCNNYGFVEVKDEFEINTEDGELKKVTRQDEIEGEEIYISAGEDGLW